MYCSFKHQFTSWCWSKSRDAPKRHWTIIWSAERCNCAI